MQEIGLLGLRLDDRREYRLHVWGPSYSVGEPPVHDHPYDFTSTVVVGEMTNTRYVEDPAGIEYQRMRYPITDEDARTTDTVRLSSTASRGARRRRVLPARARAARQSPVAGHGHHHPDVVPRRTHADRVHPIDAPWVTGRSRPATPDEVTTITGAALEQFE